MFCFQTGNGARVLSQSCAPFIVSHASSAPNRARHGRGGENHWDGGRKGGTEEGREKERERERERERV